MNKLLHLVSCENLCKKIDMKGPIPDTKETYRKTMDIAGPSAMESMLVGLVSSVDTIMVGGIGPAAIAAVGITNQPKFILLALIISLNAGVTTVVARRRGENDDEGAKRCVRQALLISIILSIIMSIIGFIFAEPIMKFAGAQDDVLVDAVEYFRIIMIGLTPMCVGLTINAAQRGAGNTRISMVTNITSNIVNLIFNFFLINGYLFFPRLEVKGAAIATILGSFIAFLMSLKSVISGSAFLHISIHERWIPDKETMGGIWKITSGALAEQLFVRIGFFTYVKIVANLGTLAFATHQICMNIINVSFTFGDGFSVAIASLVGQSLGAKRADLARLYVKVSKVLLYIGSGFLAILFILGNTFLVSLFTNDPYIIEMAKPIMYIIAATTMIQTSALSYSGCLRGAGDSKYLAAVSFISIGIVRPLVAWVFCYPLGFGLLGAWFSFFTDQSMRCILSGMRFRKGKWADIVV